MQLFFVSSMIIIHLGRNPVRGGKPPNDIRMIRVVEISSGDLFHIFVNEEMDVEVQIYTVINIDVVRNI